MTDCEHVLNYEETFCTICLQPAWLIASNNGIDRIEELEKANDNNTAILRDQIKINRKVLRKLVKIFQPALLSELDE